MFFKLSEIGYSSRIRILIFLPMFFKLSEIGYPSRIRILIFLPIPDPGVKKASDPGSGSATLIAECL
jgi:hypothetical protein